MEGSAFPNKENTGHFISGAESAKDHPGHGKSSVGNPQDEKHILREGSSNFVNGVRKPTSRAQEPIPDDKLETPKQLSKGYEKLGYAAEDICLTISCIADIE